jgi:hypothetical protein
MGLLKEKKNKYKEQGEPQGLQTAFSGESEIMLR